jgi:hypothetical protein
MNSMKLTMLHAIENAGFDKVWLVVSDHGLKGIYSIHRDAFEAAGDDDYILKMRIQ